MTRAAPAPQLPPLPPLLSPRSPAALTGMLAAVLNAALRVMIVPLFVTPVVDQVLTGNDLSTLRGVLLVAGAIAIGQALALWAQDALLSKAAAELAAKWREGLFVRLLRHQPGQLPGSSGGLASRILTDLREIEIFFQYGLGTLVAESVTLVGVLLVLAATNATATLYLVLLSGPLLLLLRRLGHLLEAVARRSQAGIEDLGGQLQEGLRHHEVVRSFAADDFLLERFRPVNRRTARAMTRRSVLAGLQIPVAQLLIFAAVAVLVVLLSGSVSRGSMTAGEVITFVTLVALLATPAQLLPKGYAMLRQAQAASKRLYGLTRAEPELVETTPVDSAPPPATATGPVRLELERLSFAFTPDEALLDGVTVHLNGPGLVVLAGPSGVGKTTLLRLLLRFLQPTGGEIRLDGTPLNDLAEAELRRRIGYVPQGHELFSGSLRDNLCLGRSYDEDALWQALETVRLAALVRTLPGGLDYDLGEGGEGISGGQRQRLALARALLLEPRVLLLDEPTSNLDEENEAALVRVLREQAEQRLVLAVAHRPALIAAADEVYLLEAGRLAATAAVSVEP